MSAKQSVLSCIQPTGYIHLGNYFGAVKNWVDLQEKYDCFYGVVDYHAMTMPYVPAKLRQNTWELIFKLIAVGVEPENLFVQSLVPEHTELGWILNCFCSYGNLTRMTQFKDKSSQLNEKSNDAYVSVGLFDYPVLQSSDILIYKADFVPVGKDQDQHLELTRDIANRFNNMVGKEYFALPQTLHTETPKILSTADPSRKMSKSAGEKHYISLFEDDARIRKQIKSAVTDTGDTPDGEMSPGVENLFTLLKASGNEAGYEHLMDTYYDGHLKYSDLKESVAESLIEMLEPFKAKYAEISVNKKEVKNQIKQSSYEIRKVAQQTLKEVKELTGLLNVRF
jgi:tryptophanyl-tRNA synthetase